VSDAVFDELIHAPVRLQICALLSPVRSLAFAELRERLVISDSVLSKQLSSLAAADYVVVSRVRQDGRSRRQVALTDVGSTALRGHLAALREIVDAAESRSGKARTARPSPIRPAPARPTS